MAVKKRERTGTQSMEPRAYEYRHRETARRAAAGGIVLLKNENNVLPLDKKDPIALFGKGAYGTIIGGSGSGKVNAREFVSVYEGLKNAGFTITSEDWIRRAKENYEESYRSYRETVMDKIDSIPEEEMTLRFRCFKAYKSTVFTPPIEDEPEQTEADTALYVISRESGEGQDRHDCPGDYQLTGQEKEILHRLCGLYEHVVLIINSGGIIDLSILDECENIHGVVYMHQPGMEAGNVLADVLSGAAPACGKLSDTWAYRYSDYPSSAGFSHNNGDLDKEIYEEDIYTGYRYFDTFEVPVRYGFGYGLSYTDFDIELCSMEVQKNGEDIPKICMKVKVENTGKTYAGREVVQVYAACPQTELLKEYRRLVGFAKTELLAPGQSQILEITFSASMLTSYDEALPGWVLDAGVYGIFVGNSLENSRPVSAVKLSERCVWMKTVHICPLKQPLQTLKAPRERVAARRAEWESFVENTRCVHISSEDIRTQTVQYDDAADAPSEASMKFLDGLSEDEIIRIVVGEITSASGEVIGTGGILVPGSGGQTSSFNLEKGVPAVVLADGPAGLRIKKEYCVVDGEVKPITFAETFAGGIFDRGIKEDGADVWYQFCTAFPTGTTLAQTWDVNVLTEVGHAVAEEMVLFGVSVWLAPGMNIHRNPLCGRNYEYYSEDPVLSGAMAAAVTEGVLSLPGCSNTLKHLACNNTEDNRINSDSILSERALREIYLKGYELAVQKSHPTALMTSYNKINGVHTANNYDLCMRAARCEWGFQGIFVTDWTTTQNRSDCTAGGCMRAGNDLIMPGSLIDVENMKKELQEGTLKLDEVKRCAARILDAVRKSGWYE